MPKNKETAPYRDSRVPMRSKIANGCYIDFEGFANPNQRFPPPVLIGLYRSGECNSFDQGFQQVVFGKSYRWATESSNVDNQVVYCENREEFLTNLVNTSSKTKPLFAFTEHEFGFFKELVGNRIDRKYRNVRLIAKRWCKREAPKMADEVTFLSKTPEEWSLREIAEAMGFPLTGKLPRGGVTERLRQVKEHSKSRARWESAPDSVHIAWKEILEHNREDVRLIYDIMNQIRPAEGGDE